MCWRMIRRFDFHFQARFARQTSLLNSGENRTKKTRKKTESYTIITSLKIYVCVCRWTCSLWFTIISIFIWRLFPEREFQTKPYQNFWFHQQSQYCWVKKQVLLSDVADCCGCNSCKLVIICRSECIIMWICESWMALKMGTNHSNSP